jgi:hypothetical protein
LYCNSIDMEKDSLVKLVKDWMKNDSEIKMLQKEQSIRRLENKRISSQLVELMKQHEIDCLEIKDGKIVYKKRNIKKTISKKQLLIVLSTYFQGDQNKAEELNNYILDNREIIVKESVQFISGSGSGSVSGSEAI